MASGSYTGFMQYDSGNNYSSSYLTYTLAWDAIQDVVTNTTLLTLTMSYNGYGTSGRWGTYESTRLDGTWTVDGETLNVTKYLNDSYGVQGNNQVVTMPSFTKVIKHQDNGKASVNLNFFFQPKMNYLVGYSGWVSNPEGGINQIGGTTYLSVWGHYPNRITNSNGNSNNTTGSSAGVVLELPTIPRATQITSFPNFTIGNDINITLERKDPDFTNKLELKSGNTLIKTLTGIATSATLTLTEEEKDLLYSTTPNSSTQIVTLHCTTYRGNSQIGSTVSSNSTATVPSSIVPTFTSITATELSTNVSTIVGAFVKTLSDIQLKINGASGAKSSTINSYKINLNGVDYSSATANTGIINWSGTKTITATITDSRGRTAVKTLNISVLDYTKPNITQFRVDRCNSDGSLNAMGTYAKVSRIGSTTSLNSKNNYSFKVYSRPKSYNDWGAVKSSGTSNIGDVVMNHNDILTTYDTISSFDFKIEFSDKFNLITVYFGLSTGAVVMSWSKVGLGVGKVHERGTLDVYGDVYIDGKLSLANGESIDVESINTVLIDLEDKINKIDLGLSDINVAMIGFQYKTAEW